jgi:hypothetical protein
MAEMTPRAVKGPRPPPHLLSAALHEPFSSTTPPVRNRVTRLLCATTHLHGAYADRVYRALLAPSEQATAPCWGMDCIRLAKHAVWARERRRVRDTQLAGALCTAVAVMAAAGCLAALLGTDRKTFIVIFGTSAAAVWVFAWKLIYEYYQDTHDIVRRVLYGDEDPNIDVSERLDEFLALGPAPACNVVVFDGDSPFIDVGVNESQWLFKVDISRGKVDGDGRTAEPEPFSTTTLSEYVSNRVTRKLPDVHCTTRLYASGHIAPYLPGLMYKSRSGYERPSARVSAELINHFTEKPTEGARTYICCQKSIWGGQVVISFLLHFHRLDDLLFVEASVWSLPPLHNQYMDGLTLAHDIRADRSALIRQSLSATTGLVLRSPYKAFIKPVRDRRVHQRRLATLTNARKRGYLVNYGNSDSLRSEAADPHALKHFSETDTTIHVRRIEGVAFAALNTFLDRHGIDTSRLTEQFNVIINQNSTTIQNVANSAINTGNAGSASATTTTRSEPRETGSDTQPPEPKNDS